MEHRLVTPAAMGARQQAALSSIQAVLPIGDRHVCAMTSPYSGARLLHGDSVRRSTGGRKRPVLGGSGSPIRSEATPATRGDDDEPCKYHLFRHPSRGGAWSRSNFHKHLNGQHPLVNRSIAKSATTKTEGLEMDEITNDDAEDGTKLESEYPMHGDLLLPHSLACEFLHLASRICDEVESKFQLHKSKKPQRLSTTSWDLLD